ncbi:MAG: hypothetical protein A2452_01810 [Candidatus Firestonebacteria bacterium RIFOXYC2_FULL_39_67]|nr:MAG: hypothetical protein A2536_07320 [Candidatus Firestonebacteria bacterium RIFOXYD2_FULL_39_29]OGF53726.1 MAG: hypothetical protein A2452_01810 [Candidatus Firestonebacteria bacterium RIFOXYC2_FULL_39_67]
MKTFILLFIMLISMFCETKYIEAPLDFPNTPVKTALETVFLKAGVKYSIEVYDLPTYGNVTLTITAKQELDVALSLILEPKSLTFIKDANGVYHILKTHCGTSIPRVTKLYPLTYVSAGDIVRQARSVLTKDGIVSVDISENSLIFTDFSEVYEGIEQFIKENDVRRKNPDIQLGLLFAKNELPDKRRILPSFLEIKELIKYGKLPDSYMFELISKEKAVTDGEFIVKNSKVNVKCSAVMEKDGDLKLTYDITLTGNEILPVANKIKTEITINNGETYPIIKAISDGKSYGLFVTASVKDYAQPRCKNTPWISQYAGYVPRETEVLLDWKSDVPFGGNGISHYRVYRDTKTITDVRNMKPFQDFIDGGSTSWIDTSSKDRSRTYYYVVTAVNASGMEQSIDPSGRSNAVITIPER